VVPVLRDDGFRVELFDAACVGHGPIAVLEAPRGATVPFLIHAAWMPAAIARDAAIPRLRFADDIDRDRVGSLDDDLSVSVTAVADELG
jgi:hypothetical protein